MLLNLPTLLLPPPIIPNPKLLSKPNSVSAYLTLLSQPNLTLLQTKSIHAQLFKSNLHHNANLTLLVRTIYSQDSLTFKLLLNSLPFINTYTALQLLYVMLKSNVHPDKLTLLLHHMYFPLPYSSNHFSPLLRMPNIIEFNLIINFFSLSNPFLAFHLFTAMLYLNIPPDKYTLPSAINVCASINNVSPVLSLHAFCCKNRFIDDPFVVSALINAYMKYGRTEDALNVLDEFPEVDIPVYNCAINGFLKLGKYESALKVFARMRYLNIFVNETTFSSVIMGCGRLVDEVVGLVIHGHIIKAGAEVGDAPKSDDIHVSIPLSFSKFPFFRFKNLESAELVFHSMPYRNIISWNSMINAYVFCSKSKEAWNLFVDMLIRGVEPSDSTLTSMVTASQSLIQGRMMHAFVVKAGLTENDIIGAAVVDMYIRLNSLVDAQNFFDEAPQNEIGSWNSLILGYSTNGYPRKALDLFYKLIDHASLCPNSISFVGALKACVLLGDITEGISIHEYIVSANIIVDSKVNTSLIDMYSKSRKLKIARELFEGMRFKDVVAWRAMINGYLLNGFVGEAMKMFNRLRSDTNLILNDVTFTSFLSMKLKDTI